MNPVSKGQLWDSPSSSEQPQSLSPFVESLKFQAPIPSFLTSAHGVNHQVLFGNSALCPPRPNWIFIRLAGKWKQQNWAALWPTQNSGKGLHISEIFISPASLIPFLSSFLHLLCLFHKYTHIFWKASLSSNSLVFKVMNNPSYLASALVFKVLSLALWHMILKCIRKALQVRWRAQGGFMPSLGYFSWKAALEGQNDSFEFWALFRNTSNYPLSTWPHCRGVCVSKVSWPHTCSKSTGSYKKNSVSQSVQPEPSGDFKKDFVGRIRASISRKGARKWAFI